MTAAGLIVHEVSEVGVVTETLGIIVDGQVGEARLLKTDRRSAEYPSGIFVVIN